MSTQDRAWLARPAASLVRPETQSVGATPLPAWLTNSLLMLASGVLFTLACASAWLSYHAQVVYVLDHNGGQAAEAKVWALLLDAGTAGVSVLRLYETLRRRPGAATRCSLLGCITVSVTMNMLHTPSRTPGGFLVAAVPPLMYAVFLEHLLTNLRSLLVTEQKQHNRWRTFVLWLNFPSLMWRKRRRSLRRAAEGASLELERIADHALAAPCAAVTGAEELEQKQSSVAHELKATNPARRSRRGRGPGPKRIAFEAALAHQLRSGDLRLFSEDERERNAAAYDAAASLTAPLSRGTARRYVVQALPRLEEVLAADDPAEASATSMVSS